MSREWQQNSMLNPTNIVLNDIAEERRHQIVKGYDTIHDDALARMELTDAGIAFAQGAILLDQKRRFPEIRISTTPGAEHWPFEPQTYKPGDSSRQNLVRSCAMLVAEIERLDRQAEEKQDSLKPEADLSLDESPLEQIIERQKRMQTTTTLLRKQEQMLRKPGLLTKVSTVAATPKKGLRNAHHGFDTKC